MFIFKFRSRFRFWFRFSFVGQALMQNHQQARITCFFDWLIDHKKNALQVFSCFNVFKSCRVESSQVESSRKNPHKTHKTHIILILLQAGWRHIESQKGGPKWPSIAFRHSNVFFCLQMFSRLIRFQVSAVVTRLSFNFKILWACVSVLPFRIKRSDS